MVVPLLSSEEFEDQIKDFSVGKSIIEVVVLELHNPIKEFNCLCDFVREFGFFFALKLESDEFPICTGQDVHQIRNVIPELFYQSAVVPILRGRRGS